MKENIGLFRYMLLSLLCLTITGCDSLLDVKLSSSELNSATIYVSDETAEAAVNGIYQSMVALTYNNYLHIVPGETSDEMFLNTFIDNVYTSNQIPVNDGTVGSMWANFYTTIYDANSVIEGINNSTSLTASSSEKWLAEAKFVRAFCYFYMVNIWGDVPLILTIDVEKTALAPRTSVSDVYNQIKVDLEEAADNLPEDYSSYSSARIRATKWTAEAMLARVNLYLENWQDAESYATSVIGNTSLFSLIQNLSSTNSPFITNNTEAIWQLPYYALAYTYEGSALFTSAGTYLLRNTSLFEDGDARATNWTTKISGSDGKTYYAPRKYKNSYSSSPSERSTVIRLAELYLIRAEARAEQDDLSGAVEDLKAIRGRALLTGSGSDDNTSKTDILTAISKERQRELFAEYGHRWFDLKRTGKADEVLAPLKSAWVADAALYPITQKEIDANPYLTQNPGY